MRSKEEYEAEAFECIRVAERAREPSRRALLLSMAQRYRRLAAQAQRFRLFAARKKTDDEGSDSNY